MQSNPAPEMWVARSGGLQSLNWQDAIRRSTNGITMLSQERDRPRLKCGCQMLASPAMTMGNSTVQNTRLAMATKSRQNSTRNSCGMPAWGA